MIAFMIGKTIAALVMNMMPFSDSAGEGVRRSTYPAPRPPPRRTLDTGLGTAEDQRVHVMHARRCSPSRD